MRSLNFMKIQEILRIYELGLSYREIAASVGCSKTTVGAVISKCKKKGITYASVKDMSGDKVKQTFDADDPKEEKEAGELPNWPEIHKRLMENKRLNLRFIWEEKVAEGMQYSYSYFCVMYRKWKNMNFKDATMVQTRKPGKELFIDWVGDTIECVRNDATGNLEKAHFFVTTLGTSSYPFVEAFPNENELSWIQGHIDAFKWYGGLPEILVPDNCKTAVIKANIYEPSLNDAYSALSRFYNVAIIPARVRKPRDKGSVESSVGWLETWLLEWVREKIYTCFDSLNADIKLRLQELVERKFQKRNGSRKSIFLEQDKPALRSLPKDLFDLFETKIINKVPSNYHVEFKDYFYSVPYQYIDEEVTIHGHITTVEIFNKNRERIALHKRSYFGDKYITVKEHMPESHRKSREISNYTAEDYLRKAKAIGVNAYNVILKIIENNTVPEKRFRICLGIINLTKKYSSSNIEMACSRALYLKSYSYTTIENILKNHQETQPIASADTAEPTPEHENLRTGEWEQYS